MQKVTTTEAEIARFCQDVQTKLRQRVREASLPLGPLNPILPPDGGALHARPRASAAR